jgi:hypothetical protein
LFQGRNHSLALLSIIARTNFGPIWTKDLLDNPLDAEHHFGLLELRRSMYVPASFASLLA